MMFKMSQVYTELTSPCSFRLTFANSCTAERSSNWTASCWISKILLKRTDAGFISPEAARRAELLAALLALSRIDRTSRAKAAKID